MNSTTQPAAPQRTALLVIDVQQAMFTKSAPVYQSEMLLANILSLTSKARKAGAPVVWVQHSDARDLIPGTPGWQLHPDLIPEAQDLKLMKEKGNAFENTKLKQLLAERGVDDVLVIGGGIIPEEDIPALKAAGIAEVFTPGTSTAETVKFIREHVMR